MTGDTVSDFLPQLPARTRARIAIARFISGSLHHLDREGACSLLEGFEIAFRRCRCGVLDAGALLEEGAGTEPLLTAAVVVQQSPGNHDSLDVVRMGVWARPPSSLPEGEAAELDMSEVSLFDLIDAFRSALVRYKVNHPQSLELRRTLHKLSDKMIELYGRLKEKSPFQLQWFLEGRDRDELIAVFLGMLELVRLGAISLKQRHNFGEILVAKTDAPIDEAQFAIYDDGR